jgi:hypothetical protein
VLFLIVAFHIRLVRRIQIGTHEGNNPENIPGASFPS